MKPRDRAKSGRRAWPEWLEILRPEPAARRRLRAAILSGATPILRAARRSWTDVAAEWARPLVPLAAGVTLAFAALAWAATGAPDAETPGAEAALPWEADVAAREMTEVPSWLLTATREPDADGILAAIVYRDEPMAPRPAGGR